MIKQSELCFYLYATYTFSIPLSDLPPYCLGGACVLVSPGGVEQAAHMNPSSILLLNFYVNHSFSITYILFEHKGVHKCTRHQDILGCKLMIDFVNQQICSRMFWKLGNDTSKGVRGVHLFWAPPRGHSGHPQR